MRRTTNRPSNDEWDGVDRRSDDNDRRYEQRFYPAPVPPVTPVDNHNASSLHMTLKEYGGITTMLIGVIFAGSSLWNNLTRDIETQKMVFSQFKEQVLEQVNDINTHINELKQVNDKLQDIDKKDMAEIVARIQELDTSVNQLYQKLREKK
jgi:tetrahydromethanopterin S-methyltransferase subunit B